MQYTKFTVSNYRCYNEEQKLTLGIPREKLGSGITYIVGANNSGKTTLIESMWIKGGHYLNDSEKKALPPKFEFYSNDELVRTVKLLRDNAFVFIEEPEDKGSNNERLFEIISSRRHWDTTASGDVPTSTVIQQSKTGDNPRRNQNNVQIALFLKSIESDTTRYAQFTHLVQRVIPEFTDWAVGFESNPYIKYISSNGISHKADFLGDGVISIIRILAHLFEDEVSGLIIDEPELSLHPLAQKRLIKVIAEYAQKRQIVISTHSPYFISWEYIKNGAVLNRVVKHEDKSSKIYTLKNFETYAGLIKSGNWKQPFLMDEVSKEIFFQDNIIFGYRQKPGQ